MKRATSSNSNASNKKNKSTHNQSTLDGFFRRTPPVQAQAPAVVTVPVVMPTIIRVPVKTVRKYIHDQVFNQYNTIYGEEFKQDFENRQTLGPLGYRDWQFQKVTDEVDYLITDLRSLLTINARVSVTQKPQPIAFKDSKPKTLTRTINQDAGANPIITRQLYIDTQSTKYVKHHVEPFKHLIKGRVIGASYPAHLKKNSSAEKKREYDTAVNTFNTKEQEYLTNLTGNQGKSDTEAQDELNNAIKEELKRHIRTIRRLLKGSYASKQSNGAAQPAAEIDELHDLMAKIWGVAESYRNPTMIAYLIMTLHNLKHEMVTLDQVAEKDNIRAYAPSQEGASAKLMQFASASTKNPTDTTMRNQMEMNILLFFESVFRNAQNGGFNAQNEYSVEKGLSKALVYTDRGSTQDAAAFDLLWQGIIDTKIINHLQ